MLRRDGRRGGGAAITMDKLRAIRFFCRVVEAKSFAAAAHDLAVVPSVLSKTIAALEADIGFRLFNRTTRRVSLTENGALYYDRCKRLVVDLEEAEVLTRDGVARPAGRLLAGLHPAVNRIVMGRIDEFLARYPDISVETTLVSTTSSLIEDRLDVLIAVGQLRGLELRGAEARRDRSRHRRLAGLSRRPRQPGRAGGSGTASRHPVRAP